MRICLRLQPKDLRHAATRFALNLGLVFNCYAEFAQHFRYADRGLVADKFPDVRPLGIGAVASILFLSSAAVQLVGFEPPGFGGGMAIPRLSPELIPGGGEPVDVDA
jgi:hypothetical protein